MLYSHTILKNLELLETVPFLRGFFMMKNLQIYNALILKLCCLNNYIRRVLQGSI